MYNMYTYNTLAISLDGGVKMSDGIYVPYDYNTTITISYGNH